MSYNGNHLVTVVVPIFNSSKYLEKCIKSIINQSYQNIEIILVDDGSTETSTIQIYNRLLKQDRRIRAFRQKNKGVSSARNFGLKVASGTYITFVDSDDFIDVNHIENLLDTIKASDSDISICNYREVYQNTSINRKIKANKANTLTSNEAQRLLFNTSFGGFLWNKLFRTNIIQKNQLSFDESISMCEDLLFVATYLTHCNKASISDTCTYNYLSRRSSIVRSRDDKIKNDLIKSYQKIENLYNQENIKNDSFLASFYSNLYIFLSRKQRHYIKSRFYLLKSLGKICTSRKISSLQKTKTICKTHFRFIYNAYLKSKQRKYICFD